MGIDHGEHGGNGEDRLRIVVKLGGSLLTDWDLLHKMVAQLAAVQDHGHEVIVVHGGSKQIKEYLEKLRIPSHFHNGLRVTDLATMQVVQMVLAGLVNKQIVAAFSRIRHQAIGLCGGDGGSFIARKYQAQDPADADFDYGFVGEVFKGDSALIDLALERKYFPIIACIAMGEDGSYYNINADEMAAAASIFCRAARLIFLTDVPGVLDANHEVFPSLTLHEIEALRSKGIITDGMLPKTRACQRALENGIQQVHIVGGKVPDCLRKVLLRNESLGTAIH